MLEASMKFPSIFIHPNRLHKTYLRYAVFLEQEDTILIILSHD